VDPILIAVLGIIGMFVLIVLQVPIGLSMAAMGLIGYGTMASYGASLSLLASETVTTITSIGLSVIPLFLLMGNFASAAGISKDFYDLAYAVMGRRRGGLAMSTIGACGLFGAICGSSFATTATFGTVALPEMLKRSYSPSLALGCIAAGGNLGTIVPPSIILVIYAILAEQNIIDLFIAAIVPAALTILFYLTAIYIYVRIYPESAPFGEAISRSEIIRLFGRNWSTVLLVAAIAGGIYGGVFTVNEAAALGAILAFVFAIYRRKMTPLVFWRALTDTASTTAMIYTIMIGASVFNYFIVASHLPDSMTKMILGSGWPNWAIIVVLMIIYLILGSVFDTIASMIITLPFVLPMILNMGYSPIWWGIINLVVVEIGVITPPIGMNVFVLHGVARQFPLSTIFRGIVPFLFADFVRLTLLLVFPLISLCLLGVWK
jgi:C4-dicarboxylate transporter, DctM subunit